MSDADSSHALAAPHGEDAPGGHEGDGHGAHGSGHGHGAAEAEPLGPIDWAAWAYALAGAALGLLVVIALYLASA